MTKRFELKANFLNGHCDIVDWVESEQKDAICIFNDLGVLPFSSAPSVCNLLNQFNNENEQLKKENEQLKFNLEGTRSDKKQLGISFMEFKMKLIEKLQIHYDYATEQKQKNFNNISVAKAYDIIRYDIKKLAEEMGVDLE